MTITLSRQQQEQAEQHQVQTFEEQLDKMYNLSCKQGDITLIVKEEDEDDEKLTITSPEKSGIGQPPNKKRKLNNLTDATVVTSAPILPNISNSPTTTDTSTSTTEKDNQETEEDHIDDTEALDDDDDVDLAPGIRIASCILRSSSKVFDRVLSANMKEQQEKTIVVHAKKIEDVKEMVYFMSTNKLGARANPLRIIHLAKLYEMDRLFWKCVERIIQNISVESFVEAFHVFNRYDVGEGFESICAFGKEHVDDLRKMDNFDTLPCSFRRITLGVKKRKRRRN